MQQYKDLLSDVLANGIDSDDRTGTGTKSVFGRQARYDLSKGFPLVTVKKTFWKGVVYELLWMLSGSTNTNDIPEFMRHWWTPWANDDGSLGPTYGKQFRNVESYVTYTDNKFNLGYRSVDQLVYVINEIKTNPSSRRLNICLWNVSQIEDMNLPPCHGNLIQFYNRAGKLSCHMYQRSGDLFLGVPVNIAFYALLTHLIANECGLEVGELIHSFGDLHLYNNHIDQAKIALQREPLPLPTLKVNLEPGTLIKFIDNDAKKLSWDEIKQIIDLQEYKSHGILKGEVSV